MTFNFARQTRACVYTGTPSPFPLLKQYVKRLWQHTVEADHSSERSVSKLKLKSLSDFKYPRENYMPAPPCRVMVSNNFLSVNKSSLITLSSFSICSLLLFFPSPAFISPLLGLSLYESKKQLPDPKVSLWLGFFFPWKEPGRKKVMVSIWASVAKSLFSSPGDVLCRSSSLQRLKESVTNVTRPGNQWHGEMKAVTDVDDHISSCHRVSTQSILLILAAAGTWGGPCQLKPAWPRHALEPRKAQWGPFLEKKKKKGFQGFRHSHHQINQLVALQTKSRAARTTGELFLISDVLTWEIKALKS